MLEAFFDEPRESNRRRGWSISRFEVALYVFSENIAFEIHLVASLAAADVGVLVGVGNYGDFGGAVALVPSRDGQADAVDGDGTLGHDVSREVFGDLHAKPPVVASRTLAIEVRHAAGAIYVSENEVAAKFFSGG